MPKNIIDYSKGVIYEIVCRDINIPNKYAGSTCNFKGRKTKHKSDCNKETNTGTYVYQFIRENGGWDNWQMLQICEYPCANKHELLFKEREYIELYGCDLNKVIPIRTQEEIIEQHKEYYNENKDKIIKQHKEYREENKIIIRAKEKLKRINMNDNDKNALKDYNKKYTELNKEQLKLKSKEHFICECGSSVAIYEKQRHYRTKKHCQFIISQKITIL